MQRSLRHFEAQGAARARARPAQVALGPLNAAFIFTVSGTLVDAPRLAAAAAG